MSASVMGQIWDLDLPHAEAWVLMALADHADHDGGNAYPGQELLAYKTGYSVRQVRRVLDALEEKKIIVAESGGQGRGRIRIYRILLQNAPRKEKPARLTKSGQNVHYSENRKPDRVSTIADQKSGQNVRYKADKMSTIPTVKGDICDREKGTFSTLKGDIFDTSHDKERARLTVHEPSIEPERERAAHTLSLVDDIANTLRSLYGIPDRAGWQLRDKFQHLAIQLDGIGATLLEVQTFYDSRQKKPGVNFFVGDFLTWRASQTPSNSNGYGSPTYPPVVSAPADYRRPKPKPQDKDICDTKT